MVATAADGGGVAVAGQGLFHRRLREIIAVGNIDAAIGESEGIPGVDGDRLVPLLDLTHHRLGRRIRHVGEAGSVVGRGNQRIHQNKSQRIEKAQNERRWRVIRQQCW